jgi:lytic murein transglycosylase
VKLRAVSAALVFFVGVVAEIALASEPCRNTADFRTWLAEFRREAEAEGISPATIRTALDGVVLDPKIIARDRRQDFFWQDFLAFSGKLATSHRVVTGQRQTKKHAPLFARIESTYGTPAPVLAALWALETDFGVVMGKTPVLPSLVTLAYDCRRGEFFREELKAALRIIDRGDLKPAEMIGSWAGELGQMQFLPAHYLRHGVDFDGDGRTNLLASSPDALGSTAAYLASLGWRRNEPWLVEVRVPADMAWAEADIGITHPVSHWRAAGVIRPDGRPLDEADTPTSLVLPMGRNGPAFLAYPNFGVFLEWNQSLNYALTAAYLATRIAGEPAMRRGNGTVEAFGAEEVKRLQTLLERNGFAVGKIDGKLGARTRGAVRESQIRHGLPPDGYPTAALLEKLAAQ